jgi:transposase
MNSNSAPASAPAVTGAEPEYAAFVSLDWADEQHAWALQVPGQAGVQQGTLKNTPEAVEQWAQQLAERFGGRCVAVALEQRRGALVAMLGKYAHLVLYPIHPTTMARYREALVPSGAKSDPGDTLLQLDLLVRHRDRLKPLQPDTVSTRSLQLMVEDRRKLVDQKTAYRNHLTAMLKQVFPQALRWLDDVSSPLAGAFLQRWPTLADARRAGKRKLRHFFDQHTSCARQRVEQCLAELDGAVEASHDAALCQAGVLAIRTGVRLIAELRTAIAEYDRQIRELAQAHEDYCLIRSFPGAGAAMAPRLIAALGTQRERFTSANDLQCYTGIAPVQVASGKQCWTHFRWASPKFVRQTIHEWADHSRKKCAWARAFYRQQRDHRKTHHAAIRALAFKWLRILYRCWKDRVIYDETKYRTSRPQPTPPPVQRPVEIRLKSDGPFKHLESFSA